MSSRRASQLAVLSLLLLPLLWLWPCVFRGRTFVPFDTAEFPPASLLLSQAQYDAVRDGANHDVTEVPAWFLPEDRLARDELRAGRLPTWNPHARTGAPLHAHGLLGLCYPPNWLALLADEPAARLVYLAWISLAVAGLLAFGLLREVGLPGTAAWFGAAVFELSAPMAANGFFWMRLASLVWLPGVLWAMLRVARGDAQHWRALAALAVAFAMPWLAGFPPFATTTAVLAGWLGLRLVGERWATDGRAAAVRLGTRFVAGALLGAMLAMPQVLPSLLFFPQSARTPDPSLATIALSRFDAYGLLGYVVPDAFGHPTDTSLPYGQSPLCYLLCDRYDAAGKALPPKYNYTEYAVFLGTLGLLLAAFGALRGTGRLRLFVLLTFALLLGLALFLPGVHLLYLLPVVKNVWPMRWLAPAALLLAWLAALGLQRLRDAGRREVGWLGGAALLLAAVVPYVASRPAAGHAADPTWPARPIAERFRVPLEGAVAHLQDGAPEGLDRFAAAGERAAAAGATAGLWLLVFGVLLLAQALLARRPAWRTGALWLTMALAVVELGQHGRPLLQGRTLQQPIDTPVHEFLREQARAAAPQGGFTIARASVGEMLQVQLPPGQLLAPGLRDLHFYTHFDGRSIEPLRRLLGGTFGERHAAKGYLTTSLPDARPMPGEVLPAGEPAPFARPLEHPLLDLLGVRFLLAVEPLSHAGARVGPTLRGPRGEFFVYERPRALPRAFLVPELAVLADDEAVLQAMLDPAFAPRERVLATAADAEGLATARSEGDAAPREVRFVLDVPSEVGLELGAGAAPWLVLADTFLPGWAATIDGAAATIHRCNHSQRLVRVPTTACRVRFTYRCPGLGGGFALAGFATVVLLVTCLWTAWAARRGAPD